MRQTIKEQKNEARKTAGEIRKSLHGLHKDTAPASLARIGLDILAAQTGILSGFYPYLSEIDVRPLMTAALTKGWKTALPVVTGDNDPLQFRLWSPGDPTVPGRWDIPVPPVTASEVEPDILLVPMLAFDPSGYRLGYGGGFYDRTLARLRRTKPVTAIGVAYAGQRVDTVPRQPHDQPLDWILTEDGAFRPTEKV